MVLVHSTWARYDNRWRWLSYSVLQKTCQSSSPIPTSFPGFVRTYGLFRLQAQHVRPDNTIINDRSGSNHLCRVSPHLLFKVVLCVVGDPPGPSCLGVSPNMGQIIMIKVVACDIILLNKVVQAHLKQFGGQNERAELIKNGGG